MKKIICLRTLGLFLVVLVSVSLIVGCAGKKPPWGNAESGFILNYQLQKDQVWKYENKTNQIQIMELNGNAMEISTDVSSVYTITGNGLEKNKLFNSTVKMESISNKVKTPQGEREIDLSSIIGKDFGMTFKRCGKKVNFSNPDNIKVDLGPGGKQDAEKFFKNLLPRLGREPVKIGGSWKVTEKDSVNQGGLDIAIETETTNIIQGVETIEGMECLKIKSKFTLSMEGSGQQMGADVLFEGEGDGTHTWYFAYKKGLFVKSNIETLMEGTAIVSGGQNMTIPITQERSSEVKLVL